MDRTATAMLHPPYNGPPHAVPLPVRGTRAMVIDAPELAALPLSCRERLHPAPPRLSHMTGEWIADCGLNAVVFALFATRPDAWQIAGHLTKIGFRGRLIALSPALPNRRMVERELRADYPLLRLQVLPVLRPLL